MPNGDNPKPGKCETCRFPTDKLTQYFATLPVNVPREDRQNWWLCDVCMNTHIVYWLEYPSQHDQSSYHMIQTRNYHINRIQQQRSVHGLNPANSGS